LSFVVNELLNFEQHREELGFEDADPATISAIFEEAGKLASDVFHPINQSGDEQGCRLEDGEVFTPDGFKEAFKQYTDSGWGGLNAPEEYGGQGMPHTVSFLVSELFTGANHSFYMYPSLTHGAFGAIATWADEETKQLYLPKMVNCEWTGTMNLTESHAGTDLGMIRTKAIPQDNGKYRITGNKIFISCGEHQMGENIVHLVLAKLPDAPEGSRGISMFIVPKFLVGDDGTLGARNGVRCSSIEHKMGINASATCVLDFEDAEGFMIGKPNEGLKAMFTMMNSARLGVGIEGLGTAEVSYQNAVVYAKDRIQGKAVDGRKLPEKPADPIIHHPDVRRMLLGMRSFIEGARALAGYTALQIDISHCHPDEQARQNAEDFLGLMTPVVKGFFTDEGTAAANTAVQVYGGHGYIKEHGVEQFARDARISQIYEGTNGIQAMDLVGRKLGLNGGRAVMAYFQEVGALLKSAGDDEAMQPYTQPMAAALASLQKATQWFMQNAMQDPTNAGAGAVDFLRLFGIVAVGAMWVRMAQTCQKALADGSSDKAFYETKLSVGRFYMEHFVPEHTSLLARIETGSETMMGIAAEAF